MTTTTADQASRLRAMVSGSADTAAPIGPRCPIVAVASGKGGVGKTNVCVNLATLLARRRVRTTLIDADAGVANADVLCGLRPPRRLSAGRSARDVAIQTPGGFVLVPGSHAEVGAAGLVREATLDASSWSDLVLLDLSPGVGLDVVRPALAADRIIIVTTPEPTAVTDGYALLKCLTQEARLDAAALPSVGVVVNQVRAEAEAREVFGRIAAAADRFLDTTPTLAGWVHRDQRVVESVRMQHPVAERCPRARATRDIGRLADAIASELRVGRGEAVGVASRVARWLAGR